MSTKKLEQCNTTTTTTTTIIRQMSKMKQKTKIVKN